MPYVRRRSNRRRIIRRRRRSTPGARQVVAVMRRPRISRPLKAIRPKWASPLASAARYKFVYSDNDFDMSTSIGGGYETMQIFRGNDLFDPDAVGVGVQPYGFDPVSSLFAMYKVFASKITVRYYVEETTPKVIVTVVPSQDNSLDYIDPQDLRVMPRARQKIISNAEGLTRNNYIKSYCTTRSIFPGISVGDNDFNASVLGHPMNVWYWHVQVDTGDIAQEVTIGMDVRITYYATMSKLSNLPES